MADLILPGSLAVYDPLGGRPEPEMTGHDGIGIHTMAGSFVGTDSWFHRDGWGGTESTVGIAGSGFCKQWTPWNRQADAMLDGNPRWLSIECADMGENFGPDQGNNGPALTPAQIDRVVALCRYWCSKEAHRHCPTHWTCHREGIPARFVTSSCERGIGVHRHGIDPWRRSGCPRWSSSAGKICPRTVRLEQVRNIVVPRVAAGGTSGDWFDMVTQNELIGMFDDGEPIAERVQRQANQAIAHQAETPHSQLREMVDKVTMANSIKAMDDVIVMHEADDESALRRLVRDEIAKSRQSEA